MAITSQLVPLVSSLPRRRFLRSSVGIACLGVLHLVSPSSAHATPVSGSYINWDDGRLIQLEEGQTAICTSLVYGQMYCLVVYNVSQHDRNIELKATWSNQQSPATLIVPGTTANEGNASLILVSGNDTSTISIAITQGNGGKLECWLVSTSMPTNLQGLNSKELAADGANYQMPKELIYHSVMNSGWYQLTVINKQTQSVVIQMSQQQLIIFVVNPITQPNINLLALGTVQEGKQYLLQMPISGEQPQRTNALIQGKGEQLIWFGTSSQQDLENTIISLQSLYLPNSDVPVIVPTTIQNGLICRPIEQSQ
ncbi:hypothetical protein ORJ66_05970 [Pseudoalteromonas tunicata]|uniref:hypothetical protein n=1 Tax=Pseudoalteromonas tunicata TaxID=314281 RepID=UPI00273FDB75|nr:hypothetical protein [Pseudoalteromonas tunicata]MDP5212585.1 hypothetical protein [Pseudoalteromonas tunicata]